MLKKRHEEDKDQSAFGQYIRQPYARRRKKGTGIPRTPPEPEPIHNPPRAVQYLNGQDLTVVSIMAGTDPPDGYHRITPTYCDDGDPKGDCMKCSRRMSKQLNADCKNTLIHTALIAAHVEELLIKREELGIEI